MHESMTCKDSTGKVFSKSIKIKQQPYQGSEIDCSFFMILLPKKKSTLLALSLLFFLAGRSQAGVTDQLGREVTAPANPRRVVSLAPSVTEIIFALNRQDRLVGATRFSDYPPGTAALPKVGSYIHLDLERIVSLSPDLCIAVKDGNPKAVIKRLEKLGIPVYAVNPMDLGMVLNTIEEVAGLLNAAEEGKALVTALKKRIRAVRDKVAAVSQHPRIFFQIGITPLVAVGSGTFIDELIAAAGGVNVTAGSVPYPRLSREAVIALKPDIIIITSMARGEQFERVKAEWMRWPDIPAVRNRRIFLVNSDIFDRAAPRLVDALELLAVLIHPRRAGDGS